MGYNRGILPPRIAAVTVHLAVALILATFGSTQPPTHWWSPEVEQALGRAKANRPVLEQALTVVPTEQRPGLAFLVSHMPDGDLTSLTADFLLTNVRLAYRARSEFPWSKAVPEDIFLNDVLPYVNLDEQRDSWRQELYDRCKPLVAGCKSGTEVAQVLNSKLFPALKLGYSTQRRRPNQSPAESIEQGKASCTGLSIVLADACRAVGVPARLVGTAKWATKPGNHTWVEMWDNGWHFTGACEPDPAGLDRGWFVGDAAKAKADVPENAIWAASFRRTGRYFPLVWAPGSTAVPGENVTARYARTADTLDPASSTAAVVALRTKLAEKKMSIAALADADFANTPLTKADAITARELLWQAHVDVVRTERAAEAKDRVTRAAGKEMRYDYKVFGDKPASGRSLWISLHGGGNTSPATNDRQWENQKRLYTPAEGIYLAPRAPTNTWNLWHEPHMDRLIDRLIETLVVTEGVNPDRVYLLGYSAGGDGVYQLAPRMADRWAAAAMMAGHPNGVSLLSLRNVPFALQVGGEDKAYNRNTVAREYGDMLAQLAAADPDGYRNFVKVYDGKKHWMDGEDKVALPWMARFTRDPLPTRVVWHQTGTPHDRSYWLAVPSGTGKVGTKVVAKRDGQTVDVSVAEGVGRLIVRLDDRSADLDRPVKVMSAGKELFAGTAKRTVGTLARTLSSRGDLRLMFAAEVAVNLPTGK